jgi:glutaredoxin
MDYVLFTLPNCHKCEDMKAALKEAAISMEVQDLAEKEGRVRIRTFLPRVKRDDQGAIILPTLVCRDGDRVEAVLNTREELSAWLRSRD